MATGVLALLGSGETAPGMTRVHRSLLARHPQVDAVTLDTPYAFQENVPQMTDKLVGYFDRSLHIAITPLHFARYDETSPLERIAFKQRVREATYVFAGPGSPSYALAQWRPLALVDDFTEALTHGAATLCFSSAAAATLGSFAPPVYEIYKVGAAPFWLEGLDLMSAVGLECVVIPHWDNHEGGTYDTSRCYLGERRLTVLEESLPDSTAILGVDEHTALILDAGDDTVTVTGRARGYWRRGGVTVILENGSTTPLPQLRDGSALTRLPPTSLGEPFSPLDAAQLAEVAARGGSEGLRALAQLTRLAQSAATEQLSPQPLVDRLLTLRDQARRSGDYAVADALRDALDEAGVDVRDSVTGSTWTLRTPLT